MKKYTVMITAVALSISAALSPYAAEAALPLNVSGQELPTLAPLLEEVTPAVVNISVAGTKISRQRLPDVFRYFFGPNAPDEQVREQPFRGLGSGVIIDAGKGYVVTNYHVIHDAKEIVVTLKDGREFPAKKIGDDQQTDIALLQIDADHLKAIPFADSDNLRVGDFAIAIGNPFGLGQTVTSGIVSALGRSGLNIENLENFIQTDAAINSGNSGGALVNLSGELIGINTAILGPNGGNIGIGFAIPANMVHNLVDQIVEFGEVRRGVLGVSGGELTSELAKTFGYDNQNGAFVNQVMPGSAAEKAGLQAGDIIVSVNGKPIASFGELRAKIGTMGAGKEVRLGVVRDGKERQVKVTLMEASDENIQARVIHPALEGATLSATEPEDKVEGIKVTQLEPNSNAARAGLKEGDIIVGVNRIRVTNMKELRKVLEQQPELLALNIKRGDSSLYLILR